jgi:hypothetical protein
LMMLFLVSCNAISSSKDPARNIPASIECQVVYQSLTGEKLGDSKFSVVRGGDLGLELDDLKFTVTFKGDEFEGWTISIQITEKANGKQLVSHLFQLDSNQAVINQFLGGHGFTGLVYVTPVDKNRELQYFCSIPEEQ